MRTWLVIGLATAATAACCLVELSQTNGIVGYYREALPPSLFASWLAGFVVATIIAPTCCVLFWLIAKRSRYGWITHLLLLPMVYAGVQASAALMLFAAGEPDLDALSGHALLPAILLMVLCPTAYFVALVVRRIGGRRPLANDR